MAQVTRSRSSSDPNRSKMTGSELLLESLRRQGSDRIFGIVGREGSSIRFNEIEGMRFFLTRHEVTAGIAAEVCARSTGMPQVCFSTLGPGATNLATALSSACLDRSPLIAISAQVESFDLYYNHTQQCVDQRRIMEPMCKYTAEPTKAEEIPRIVQEAYHAAQSEIPGPSFLSIPINLFRQEMAYQRAMELLDEFGKAKREPLPEVGTNLVKAAYGLLKSAKRPIAILGNYIIRANAVQNLMAFLERFDIPAVNTYTAKGALPFSHPNNVGTVSCYLDGLLSYDCLGSIFDQTDLVLLLGYDYAEDIRPEMWTGGREKRVLRLSSFPNPIAGFHTDLDIIGDPRHFFDDLNICQPPSYDSFSTEDFKQRKQDFLSRASDQKGRLLPQQVINILNKFLDNDSVLISDVGLHRVYTTLFGNVSGYNSFFASCGCATFGFALPASIGAQIINPDKKVFAVVGDGGFHSGSQDLETLSRFGLPVVIILMKDDNMGLIRIYENMNAGEANSDTVSFGSVDFVKLAEANNCVGVHVSEAGQLEEQIRKALASKRPTVIEIPVVYDYEFRGEHHKKSLGDFIDSK
ncbi:thiamine pyrophosphate-binding protein [Candidatus Micrarchaeota archaeon]|nr:thiamine pyrophosphate-binding protein [Candidatus Micrarchaeota archaeon]MBU1166584.1 thiamine pyrophosphate-binding protein [Candidatus Micrarchaeota archaeon]MBU1887284.1 thiamine pyrophosphate-binding protein [Candidatus Micrarchaeota archaeon]